MKYAVISVPAAPVRRKPMHRKEMVNQLLFGETVEVLKARDELWVKVRSLHDNYEGWLTSNLITGITNEQAQAKSNFAVTELLSAVIVDDRKLHIPCGSLLPGYKDGEGNIGEIHFTYAGRAVDRYLQKPTAQLLKQLTDQWINVPYLWGGRTPLGVDCSGLVQIIYRLMGIDLPRDAWQQAQEGRPVKKFRDVREGDLVFFENNNAIVHVGLMISEDQVIHASGKVRIDQIDKKGIINVVTGKRGQRLRAIRRLA